MFEHFYSKNVGTNFKNSIQKEKWEKKEEVKQLKSLKVVDWNPNISSYNINKWTNYISKLLLKK